VAPILWLPQLDPSAILLAPAPAGFAAARNVGVITPAFARHVPAADYWLIDEYHDRLPAALIGGASAATPAAVDADFATRESRDYDLGRHG
jgi:hypothetical protein